MYPDTKHKEADVPSDTQKTQFIEAVTSTKHAMYRVALVMLRRPADAEDAVSEAVEAAWRNLEKVRDLDALPAYLLKSTINAAHKALRGWKRENTMEHLEALLPSTHPETPVWMYLGGMKEKYSLPLLLRYSEGLSDQEIAGILHLPREPLRPDYPEGPKCSNKN